MATKPEPPVNDPKTDPITGEFRVIAPGYTFKSVTEEISRIVLTPHTPMGWFCGFLLAGAILMMLLAAGPGCSLRVSASGLLKFP